MNNGNKVIFLAGLLFFLLGAVLCGVDIYKINKYDKTEAVVHLLRGRKNSKKAQVEYEYDGTSYQDVLNSFNAFTMKEGKPMTVYIDPQDPSNAHATSFALEIAFMLFGGGFVWFGMGRGRKNKDDTED